MIEPGTLVSDGILRGKLVATRDGQSLVTVDAGATIWLPTESLRQVGAPSPVDDWEPPRCLTPGCNREPGPSGLCRACVRSERAADRASGLVDLCTFGNCRRVAYSQNLCKPCYERERRAGNIEVKGRTK